MNLPPISDLPHTGRERALTELRVERSCKVPGATARLTVVSDSMRPFLCRGEQIDVVFGPITRPAFGGLFPTRNKSTLRLVHAVLAPDLASLPVWWARRRRHAREQ